MKIDFKDWTKITYGEMHSEALPYVMQFSALPDDSTILSTAIAFAVYVEKVRKDGTLKGINASLITMYSLAFYLGMMCERNGWHIPDEE